MQHRPQTASETAAETEAVPAAETEAVSAKTPLRVRRTPPPVQEQLLLKAPAPNPAVVAGDPYAAPLRASAAERLPYRPGPRRPSNPYAVPALICGILGPLGLLCCAVFMVLCPIAVVLGHLGLAEIRKNPELEDTRSMTRAGLILGYIGCGLILLILAATGVMLANESLK